MKYGLGTYWISHTTGSKLEIVGWQADDNLYQCKNYTTGKTIVREEEWITNKLKQTKTKSIVSPDVPVEQEQKYPIDYCFSFGIKYRVVDYKNGKYTVKASTGLMTENVLEATVTAGVKITLEEFLDGTFKNNLNKCGPAPTKKPAFCIN